ncbi:MAG: N-6 DNA methylase [Microcoleaceae cyanobacterium]
MPKTQDTNLIKKNNSYDVSSQEILKQLLFLGYAQENILLNSDFLGANGQIFFADLIVLPENHILHTNPLLVITIPKKSELFNDNLLKYWHESGAKVLIWHGESIKVFALDENNKYYEIPPFIPNTQEIGNLKTRHHYRLKSSLYPGYDLKNILSKIHDHLYGNSNIRIPSRLGIEIQKLLLVKKFDEEKPNEQCDFCIMGKELPEKGNHQMMVNQENIKQVSDRIRNLAQKYNLAKDEQNQISDIELNDESIYYTVFHLEGISLSRTPSDVLGDALEIFRSYVMKREGGQFFTPRPVVELALKLVGFTGKPDQTLADISCGTSGFLHQARRIIIQSALENKIVSEWEHSQLISDLLLGVEVDKDLVQISNTSPELEKIPQKIVEHHNSLLPFQQWRRSLLERLSPNSRAFMVGNPPFGTKITVKNREILESFALAKAWKKDTKNRWISTSKIVPRSPDILFIERNVELLRPESGKMVLVVPYQILSGPQEGFVREWLMTHCKILAVIDLPEDTFQPYTGTKGSLLVVEKRKNPNSLWEEEPDYAIFMARPEKIGHDRRGRPIFQDNIIDIDFPEISKAYDAFLQGHDPSIISQKAFIISSKSIKHSNGIRLNAAYYEPKSSDLRKQLIILTEQNPDFLISPLGELVSNIFYPGRFKRDYTDDIEHSVPFLGGSNITQLIPVTQKRILKSSPHYHELALKAGWILITRSGTTGIVATVPKDWEGFAASEHIIRIIPNPDKIHPGYLYGYLKSQIGQRLLLDGIFGSVIDEINCSYIVSIPVLYPKDIDKAKKIGEQIYKADAFRYEASNLIETTTKTIENFIF